MNIRKAVEWFWRYKWGFSLVLKTAMNVKVGSTGPLDISIRGLNRAIFAVHS